MAGSGDTPREASSGSAPSEPSEAARIAAAIVGHVPHNRALGIRFVATAHDTVTLALPYDSRLVGNPVTRVLHGGAITALLDATCGIAVFLKLKDPIPIATLDLRIDYLRPATPDREVYARAECFRTTENVAFVRCEAFHPGAEDDQVAVANGTFIISRGRVYGPRGKAT